MQEKIETIMLNNVEYVKKDSIKNIVKEERKGAWTIGRAYLIRTVTMMLTGRLVYLDDKELILEDAAWIADSGRFSEALTTGKLSEVEPFPYEVIIGRGSLIDACFWDFKLPREVK